MVKKYRADAPSSRQQKVAQLVQQTISQIILRGEVLGISPLDVSITSSSVSPDLRYATIYVIPRPSGQGKNLKTSEMILKKLNHVRGYLRSGLAKQMTSRVCPELIFAFDEGQSHLEKIDRLLGVGA